MKINLNIDKNVFLPVYYPHLFDYSKRYNIYYGGRSSGKTFFITLKLVLKGLKEKRVVLLMKKTTRAVEDSVWKELLNCISSLKLMSYFDINKTEHKATCKLNGTVFHCLGLDISDKIKGYADMSDVYLDEVNMFTMEDIELIDGTLRSIKYKLPLLMYFSFNPVSKANWIYKYFGFDTNEFDENLFVLKTTYRDNPRIDSSFIERMEQLKKKNYNRWLIEANGEWASLDKLVYNNWSIGELEIEKGDPNWLLILGLDFGYIADPSAFICSYINEAEKKIYIFNEFSKTGMLNNEIANTIRYMGYAKELIIADSAELKSIEEIKRLGIIRIRPATKGLGSILLGIQKLLQYEIIVNPVCQDVIVELQNYTWTKDKQSGEYINVPCDTYNHCLDALRYSLQCIERQTRLGSFSKKSLSLGI